MTTLSVEKTQQHIDDALEIFKRENPEVAKAMEVMNLSFSEYLQALASLKDVATASGNATILPRSSE